MTASLLGAIPVELLSTEETTERAVDPLDLLSPEEWSSLPTVVEIVMVIETEAL